MDCALCLGHPFARREEEQCKVAELKDGGMESTNIPPVKVLS